MSDRDRTRELATIGYHVPAEPFVTWLRGILHIGSTYETLYPGDIGNRLNVKQAAERIAERFGENPQSWKRYLDRLLNGGKQELRIWHADKIVTALGGPHLSRFDRDGYERAAAS